MKKRERERERDLVSSPAGKIWMASAISRAIIYNRVLVNTRTLASAANRPPFLRQLPMHKRTVNVAPPFLARRLFRWQLAGIAVTSILARIRSNSPRILSSRISERIVAGFRSFVSGEWSVIVVKNWSGKWYDRGTIEFRKRNSTN